MAATIKTIDLKESGDKRHSKKREPHKTPVPRSETILLLPHCLRVSATCKAAADDDGLVCRECNSECQINILRKAAIMQGFKGVCIAPGGSLALKYVKKTRPRAIIAVACEKELSEGIENVKELFCSDAVHAPEVTIIPLVKDGCIDTKVDIESSLLKINEQDPYFQNAFAGESEVRKTGSDW
ncbi:MAG TPA: DUF116 domain-containing protein [Spirochaetota bacterium]|nr:DUF116 domain-containing protein [Spirochaetota bacterium]HPI90356.1 DUF116 domain-containing protein [Spirochaetota bacterium]HPR48476.1 DUF116 domain-containing protein [Spirochaetota bacterium]